MDLPVMRNNPRLFAHVGNAEEIMRTGRIRLPLPRENRPCSLEGRAFSVSLHPEEWSRIAQLGGGNILVVRFDYPALDFHAWRKGRRLQEIPEITTWAIKKGLITHRNDVLIWTTDEEGEERYSVWPEGDPAIQHEREDALRVETVPGWGYTQKLISRVGSNNEACLEAEVLNMWLADQHPEIGMVWYEDDYDPENLSAPRGAILPAYFGAIEFLEVIDIEEWDAWFNENV